MTDSEAVRRVALALPRAYEVQVRGQWKFRVGQIVFVAFSADEQEMGFGFPRAERDALVASEPEKFFLPTEGDLRFQWVCARLPALDDDEMRELVVDAWRMCVPKMLHELPELPAPAARVWDLVDQQEWGEVRPLLHPYLHFQDRATKLRGPDPGAAPPRRPPDPEAADRGRDPRRAALPMGPRRLGET